METTLQTPFYKNVSKEDQEMAKFLKEVTSSNATHNTTFSYNTTVVDANSTTRLLPPCNNTQISGHKGGVSEGDKGFF